MEFDPKIYLVPDIEESASEFVYIHIDKEECSDRPDEQQLETSQSERGPTHEPRRTPSRSHHRPRPVRPAPQSERSSSMKSDECQGVQN